MNHVADAARVIQLAIARSEEHTSELQSPCNLVCRLLLEKKKKNFCLQNRLLPCPLRFAVNPNRILGIAFDVSYSLFAIKHLIRSHINVLRTAASVYFRN